MTGTAKIIVHGAGGTAQLVALALHQCGFAIDLIDLIDLIDGSDLPEAAPALATPNPADALHDDDWQRVLALAPASKICLEKLGVWENLGKPATSMTGMEVRRGPVGQGFTDTLDLTPPEPETLAHIVSLADLHRAIARTIAAAEIAPSNANINADTNANHAAALHIETKRPQSANAADYLTHDYGSDALVCAVRGTQAHNGQARQIFLPDGPLALLPLAGEKDMALVWSLQHARAQALVDVAAPVFLHELNRAAAPYGKIEAVGARATQALHMHLAQSFTAPNRAFLGDAAHCLHPMAGQGFNITLRDIALLVECLMQGRQLGLPPNDATMLARYGQARRADATLAIGLTHGLNGLFGGAVPGLGLLAGAGLEATHTLLQKQPKWRRALLAQADSGIGHTPPLMRV